MARPTEWRRHIVSFLNEPAIAFIAEPIAEFATGETVTRVRFQYQLSVFAGVPLGPWAAEVAVGIIVGPAVDEVPPATPFTEPDADWLWWEGVSWSEDVFAFDSNDDLTALTSGPRDGGYRDAKAQRAGAAFPQKVWFVMEVDPIAANQVDPFLALSTSTLVILPP